MKDPRQRHGTHTWDMPLHYYSCTQCQYIIENREKFERQANLLEKKIVCPRCQNSFEVTKKKSSSFWPILGHDPEINN